MLSIIGLIVIAKFAILYYFLRRKIYKQTIIRFDTSNKSYTEVYEKGNLIATFNNQIK